MRVLPYGKRDIPLPYKCDCGHQSDFFENTVRELKRKSMKRRIYLVDGEREQNILHSHSSPSLLLWAILPICSYTRFCRGYPSRIILTPDPKTALKSQRREHAPCVSATTGRGVSGFFHSRRTRPSATPTRQTAASYSPQQRQTPPGASPTPAGRCRGAWPAWGSQPPRASPE